MNLLKYFGEPKRIIQITPSWRSKVTGTGAGIIDEVIPVGTTDAFGFWWTGHLSGAFRERNDHSAVGERF